MRRLAMGLLAAAWIAASPKVAAQPAASPPATAPDLCIQARADWVSIQRTLSVPVLQVYRDNLPPSCIVQRALADARIGELTASRTSGSAVATDTARDWRRRGRAIYRCENRETVRLAFDHFARTATLLRFARPNVRLQQVDAPAGFRYVGADGVQVDGDDARLTVSYGAGEKLVCERR